MDRIDLFHRLPYSLRVLAASARGWQIDRWRYGSDLEPLVVAARDREMWDRERWQEWREKKLGQLLRHAATTVPHYRSLWDGRRRRGDHRSIDDLGNWPVLAKSEVRARPEAFVSECFPRRSLFVDHTSGTTGSPLTILLDRGAVRSWYALFELRVRRWNGVARGDPWAILGGQLVAPFTRATPPFWVWNASARQLYLSAFHISDSTSESYADALRQHGVRWLLGYPSALASLATSLESNDVNPPGIEVVVTNAEPLLEHQRAVIGKVFGCAVRDTYGMAEAVSGGSACEEGGMHLWPDAGVLEIVDDVGFPTAESARMIGTTLTNLGMPLVRYDIGDRGGLSVESCRCGRALPLLSAIDGRQDDILQTPDGRRIGRLDSVFKSDLPIREAQIVQRSLDRLIVRVVPTEGFNLDAERVLTGRLRDRVGAVDVQIELVNALPRGVNGKLRAVISEMHDPS